MRDAPNIVALAMSMAGSSGLFGTIGEVFTAGKVVHEATSHASELIRTVASREELEASQDALRKSITESADGVKEAGPWLADQAVMRLQNALSVLRAKSPAEAASYAQWVQDVAQKVAEASKEGGFLGFGGERVSDPERALLARLAAAIGA